VGNRVKKAESQEIVASHNLRATYDILQTMSSSKKALEKILEEKTDIFALFTESGDIIKGNKALGTILGVPADLTVKHSLKELFSPESWLIFMNNVEILRKHSERKAKNFELSVDGIGIKERFGEEKLDYLWTVSLFDSISPRRGVVYSLVGRDTSELRRAQRKLSTIFGSVPLAIFHIDSAKKIRGPCSTYTEVLFNLDSVEGIPFESLLGRCYMDMTSAQRFGVQSLLESIGGEEIWFDLNKNTFPKEVEKKREEGDSLWIGFSYSPIVHKGLIEEVLVVAEDITERVHLRKNRKSRDDVEDKVATIFTNVREMDSSTVRLVMYDISHQMEELEAAMQQRRKVGQLTGPLHAIKGTSRSAGLALFSAVIHEAEESILMAIEDRAPEEEVFVIADMKLSLIRDLFEAIKSIVRIVHEEAFQKESQKVPPDLLHSIRSAAGRLAEVKGAEIIRQELLDTMSAYSGDDPDGDFFESIIPKLKLFVDTTSRQLGKDIEFNVELADNLPQYSHKVLVKVSEVLIHLLNNAVDHGIESREERLARGKTPEGHIVIRVLGRDGHTHVEVEDDGDGIHHEKILESALRKGIISEQEAVPLKRNKEEALRLIFARGFSTKTQASEISGRGVGMDGADQAARVLSGGRHGIDVRSSPGNGTVMSFDIAVAIEVEHDRAV